MKKKNQKSNNRMLGNCMNLITLLLAVLLLTACEEPIPD